MRFTSMLSVFALALAFWLGSVAALAVNVSTHNASTQKTIATACNSHQTIGQTILGYLSTEEEVRTQQENKTCEIFTSILSPGHCGISLKILPAGNSNSSGAKTALFILFHRWKTDLIG